MEHKHLGRLGALFVGVVVLTLGLGVSPAFATYTSICHRVETPTPHFTKITVLNTSLPEHQAHGDIIPAPAGDCPTIPPVTTTVAPTTTVVVPTTVTTIIPVPVPPTIVFPPLPTTTPVATTTTVAVPPVIVAEIPLARTGSSTRWPLAVGLALVALGCMVLGLDQARRASTR